MTDGYVLDVKGEKLITGVEQLVGELPLPRGHYIVWAKADVVATGVTKTPVSGDTRLVVGPRDDRATSYLNRSRTVTRTRLSRRSRYSSSAGTSCRSARGAVPPNFCAPTGLTRRETWHVDCIDERPTHSNTWLTPRPDLQRRPRTPLVRP